MAMLLTTASFALINNFQVAYASAKVNAGDFDVPAVFCTHAMGHGFGYQTRWLS
jgi:hypothetical protein